MKHRALILKLLSALMLVGAWEIAGRVPVSYAFPTFFESMAALFRMTRPGFAAAPRSSRVEGFRPSVGSGHNRMGIDGKYVSKSFTSLPFGVELSVAPEELGRGLIVKIFAAEGPRKEARFD